jgi:hypothetical protein
MVRKYLAILILAATVFDFGGYFLFFNLMKKDVRNEIRREIEKGIPEGDLIVISVSAGMTDRIDWIEAGREFRWEGEMYDVVKSRADGDRIDYFCLKDGKEKELIAGYEKSHSNRGNQDRKPVGAFHLYFFSRMTSLPAQFGGEEISYPPYLTSYRSALAEIHTPPPERFPFSKI